MAASSPVRSQNFFYDTMIHGCGYLASGLLGNRLITALSWEETALVTAVNWMSTTAGSAIFGIDSQTSFSKKVIVKVAFLAFGVFVLTQSPARSLALKWINKGSDCLSLEKVMSLAFLHLIGQGLTGLYLMPPNPRGLVQVRSFTDKQAADTYRSFTTSEQ